MKDQPLQSIIKQRRIVDYNVEDQLTYDYLKQYGLFELANHERHFANRTETLAALIEAGFGYGVLTEEFSRPYLKQDRLMVLNENKIYENKMVLTWYDRPTPPPYFSELIHAIQ